MKVKNDCEAARVLKKVAQSAGIVSEGECGGKDLNASTVRAGLIQGRASGLGRRRMARSLQSNMERTVNNPNRWPGRVATPKMAPPSTEWGHGRWLVCAPRETIKNFRSSDEWQLKFNWNFNNPPTSSGVRLFLKHSGTCTGRSRNESDRSSARLVFLHYASLTVFFWTHSQTEFIGPVPDDDPIRLDATHYPLRDIYRSICDLPVWFFHPRRFIMFING